MRWIGTDRAGHSADLGAPLIQTDGQLSDRTRRISSNAIAVIVTRASTVTHTSWTRVSHSDSLTMRYPSATEAMWSSGAFVSRWLWSMSCSIAIASALPPSKDT